jgi:hypothetical protein
MRKHPSTPILGRTSRNGVDYCGQLFVRANLMIKAMPKFRAGESGDYSWVSTSKENHRSAGRINVPDPVDGDAADVRKIVRRNAKMSLGFVQIYFIV